MFFVAPYDFPSPSLHFSTMTQVETTTPPIAAKPPTPSVIPDPEMEGRARTLVLCFDGTGDQFDDDVGR